METPPLGPDAGPGPAGESADDLAGTAGLSCGEVRGGARVAREVIDLPGLHGVLYSRPCSGAHGGDIHYLSVCGSGMLSRLCVADVAGHGDAVAAVGAQTYDQLRRSVNTLDDRRVLRALDRRLARQDLGAMTTAVLATYYPPSRRLTIGYAGHPEAWLYVKADGRWQPVAPEPAPAGTDLVGLPLGSGFNPSFTRRRLTVAPGDRLLLLTDGVLEAPSPEGVEFGREGLSRVLDEPHQDVHALVERLLSALTRHTGGAGFAHDDVTVFAGEFVDGPERGAVWYSLRNRLGLGPRVVAPVRSL